MANPPMPAGAPEAVEPSAWRRVRTNVLLFVLTVASVYLTGGLAFMLCLLAILLAHEFGHYFAARYHRVPASLPYFIPLPFLSPFGTAGAVISMRGAIRSRNALLDIGASGPLAGMVVALPVLAWGLAHSEVNTMAPPYIQEGQSLLYLFMKWLIWGPIPTGQDVSLHPVAFAGWAGLFVTMINLLPFGQLDGGHIAYALVGERQNRIAPWMRWALLPLFLYNVVSFSAPMLLGTAERDWWSVFNNSLFWLFWFGILGLLSRFSGGSDHPPCERGELSPWRRGVAWFSLLLFVVLFMPTPISQVP
jgi:membrane-associated protease RseP (regulator of RpoE activity)